MSSSACQKMFSFPHRRYDERIFRLFHILHSDRQPAYQQQLLLLSTSTGSRPRLRPLSSRIVRSITTLSGGRTIELGLSGVECEVDGEEIIASAEHSSEESRLLEHSTSIGRREKLVSRQTLPCGQKQIYLAASPRRRSPARGSSRTSGLCYKTVDHGRHVGPSWGGQEAGPAPPKPRQPRIWRPYRSVAGGRRRDADSHSDGRAHVLLAERSKMATTLFSQYTPPGPLVHERRHLMPLLLEASVAGTEHQTPARTSLERECSPQEPPAGRDRPRAGYHCRTRARDPSRASSDHSCSSFVRSSRRSRTASC